MTDWLSRSSRSSNCFLQSKIDHECDTEGKSQPEDERTAGTAQQYSGKESHRPFLRILRHFFRESAILPMIKKVTRFLVDRSLIFPDSKLSLLLPAEWPQSIHFVQ